MSWFSIQDEAIELDVIVVPRASKNRVVGLHDDRVKIQLNAPPVDGEANAALVRLLCKQLGLRKADVEIVSGQTGRRKRVRLAGASADAVRGLVEPEEKT